MPLRKVLARRSKHVIPVTQLLGAGVGAQDQATQFSPPGLVAVVEQCDLYLGFLELVLINHTRESFVEYGAATSLLLLGLELAEYVAAMADSDFSVDVCKGKQLCSCGKLKNLAWYKHLRKIPTSKKNRRIGSAYTNILL